ncbi:small acid-soluble spore protein SspI [Paenibacillus sp. J5C_2022]|uniref:small acid-soluble spore protein SspI n=1 Tax=Paenibacillus sp. J5C2022 TaxID=2977129 RepID=UPI0021CF7635|nr:small acid-soluble spore protein SspI [Paenibacillus sp. J5C2022]MCU6711983.1 small acid-soluble spore protein SspI [Paenibacillus sp. J5C2022]
MNNIDLRQAIINRVQSNTADQLKEVIESSIDHDERALPGLGVLFEMIWKQSNPSSQGQMVQALHQHLSSAGNNTAANPSPS